MSTTVNGSIRLAGVVRESIVDGPGIRFAVFVQYIDHLVVILLFVPNLIGNAGIAPCGCPSAMLEELVVYATPSLPIRTFNDIRQSGELGQTFRGAMILPT